MSTSFWLDQSRSPSSSKHQFDVVVIGAGISGVSTCYWLLKEDPNLKVALIEKSRVAFGASGRNAGFITCGSVEHFNRLVERHGLEKAHEIWKFSEDNLSYLKSEIIHTNKSTDKSDGKSIDFEEKGSFSLAAADSEFAELKKTANLMEQLKIPVAVLDQNDIHKRLGAQNFVGGIKYVSDASVDPVKLVNKILQSSPGVKLFEGTEVHGVEIDGASRVVKTDKGAFSADMVIFTTNGYSPLLSPFFTDKIYPTRGQILVMEPVPPFMEGPCYANFVLDYFRQLPSGHLLIGGFRQLEKATEVGYSDHISQTIQGALHEFVQTYLPQFKDKKISHRWAGIMGFSADGQPLVGALPEDPQIFFSGGYTGHGIGLAFHCAKSLVDMIFGREIPDFLSARRFS